MKKQYPAGWEIEDTGGGCQWLRNGLIAITDGEAGLPDWGQPCVVITLNKEGDCDESMPQIQAASLEKAFADLKAMGNATRPKLTTEQFAKAFGCSVQQVADLKSKNREQLTGMYNEACRTGKRVNGYGREQLRQLITGLQLPE